jgi:hypothetical protein
MDTSESYRSKNQPARAKGKGVWEYLTAEEREAWAEHLVGNDII